jgi:hypothetical protein
MVKQLVPSVSKETGTHGCLGKMKERRNMCKVAAGCPEKPE